jgi:hypothetical protein
MQLNKWSHGKGVAFWEWIACLRKYDGLQRVMKEYQF